MVHSCAFFNNKGGVGKTTSIANLGDRIGNLGYKVVVLDLDPQCNITQYFLSDDEWEDLFEDADNSSEKTLWKFVKPITQSRSISPESVGDVPLKSGRFGFDLVPGHPFASRLDDALAEQWGNYRLGKAGGIEATLWCKLLIERLESQIENLDYVLFDLGPSLGPLNRSVLLSCDSFVSPVSPDLFSLYSFDNLLSWFTTLEKSIKITTSTHEDDLKEYSSEWWYEKFLQGLEVNFLGYISQEYVTRTTKGVRRRTRSYNRFLRQIPEKAGHLAKKMNNNFDGDDSKTEIGVMPHMYSMVSLAHDAHAPVSNLSSADGLTGAQFKQRDRYTDDLDTLSKEIIKRMGGRDKKGE
ncbi:ParA family protein [Kocuria rhizophila]|uniref:ParA family protein n=1 Tax=Kocuria rhizophila TaxID=72000 RepID=UPI0009E9B8C3|nr:AAA family ATPase [Kocuria rhizophila]